LTLGFGSRVAGEGNLRAQFFDRALLKIERRADDDEQQRRQSNFSFGGSHKFRTVED